MTKVQVDVKKRPAHYATRTVTRIWQEIPMPDNPYLAENCRCFGYDIMDLAKKSSYVDVLFLLFTGELPDEQQAQLLETLMIGFINPGPRHPATRAAMNAGVGKTKTSHILPIALSVLSGTHLGGEEVEQCMRFLSKNIKQNPQETAEGYAPRPHSDEGDFHIVPGFGARFGGVDPLPGKIATHLQTLPGAGSAIQWGAEFVDILTPQGMGWLDTGVVAATLCDLGFHPRNGAGIYQLLRAPGLLAHGMELANKPITAMPFLDEEHYLIAPQARKKQP